MDNTIYDKLNAIVTCEDFLETARHILDFSEASLCEKNKDAIVKRFYECLYQFGFMDICASGFFSEQNDPWYICAGNQAITTYFALCMPKRSTPARSLRAIKQFSEETLSVFTPPVGHGLSSDRVHEILSFLDEKYSFSRKVFTSAHQPVFCLLNVSHRTCDAQYAPIFSIKGMYHGFFLYCTNGTNDATPEDVLLHELGHALHVAYIEKTEGLSGSLLISESIKQALADLGMPSLESFTEAEQVEIIADLLHVGMLYGTTYPTCDPMHLQDRPDGSVLEQKTHAFLCKILSALD